MIISAYSIVEAENKLEETGRQITIIGAGIGGGVAGGVLGAKAATFCGPAVIFCAVPFVIIGSIVGALGAEYAYNTVVD